MNNPQPTISDLVPKTVPSGSGDVTVMIFGSGYIKASAVTVNNRAVEPTRRQSTSMQIPVAASDVAKPGKVKIVITNPRPGGGSVGINLNVT